MKSAYQKTDSLSEIGFEIRIKVDTHPKRVCFIYLSKSDINMDNARNISEIVKDITFFAQAFKQCGAGQRCVISGFKQNVSARSHMTEP